MTYIILDKANADIVCGKSGPMAELMPIPLTDGTFILGIEVLEDKAHARHAARLVDLPWKERKDIENLLPKSPLMPIHG